eukprot:TRINITY_DN1188_c0_g1_i1.p1 TRINITY_DN1188_c0_g1~~TRINITY_DN1188_c0_g1_i1.p1  ORF type:complete len:490 (-),score=101.94 TRINITY_DN1188_c0_g1_i1:352-1821(-)
MKLILAFALAATALGTNLPVLEKGQAEKLNQLTQDGKWWVKVGNDVLHQPHGSSGLSQDVGNYYFAYASEKALTPELQSAKVGGSGRAHVFHLPDGPASLVQIPDAKNGRRAAVSSLVQLTHKKVLSDARLFPDYKLDPEYENPLPRSGRHKEKQVVESLDSDSLMEGLTELTQLGDGSGTPTRSWENPIATKHAVHYMQRKFKNYGYKTCLQTYKEQGHVLTNVVAYLPNQDNSADGSVVLGAHYDSRPYEGKAPGAVDNGSGANAVLAIAKAVKDAGVETKKPIIFVGFAGEEAGVLGSKHFVKTMQSWKGLFGTGSFGTGSFLQADSNGTSSGEQFYSHLCRSTHGTAFLDQNGRQKKRSLSSAKAKTHALILDEIAWKSPNIGKKDVVNFESYDWSKDVLEELGQAAHTYHSHDLRTTHSSNPFGSDHVSFLEGGIQSALSIHGDDEAYDKYHTEADTMDQVNPGLYTKIVQTNAAALLRLAKAE